MDSKTTSQRHRSGSESSATGLDKFDEFQQKDDVNVYTDFYKFKPEMVKYKPRLSLLDEYHEDSPMSRSMLYGFYQLCHMLSCFFFVCYPISRYQDKGQFLDTDLYRKIKPHFIQTMGTWPLFILYIHFAFLIQKLVLLGMPSWVEHFLQHLSQTFLLNVTLFTAYKSENLYPSSRCFIGIMSIVFFMKSHSYTVENRRMRQERSKQTVASKKQKPDQGQKGPSLPGTASQDSPGSEEHMQYPHNINYANFFQFIWVPALVYSPNYPRKQTFELIYCLNKCLKVLLGFLGLYIILSDFIIPVIQKADTLTFLELTLESLSSIFAFIFLLFYTLEENLCSVFAELTHFADHEFYQDWWNASDLSSFFHKFNKPFGDFTTQYIYLPLVNRCKLSHFLAYSMKNLTIGLVLEFIIIITTRDFKPITLALMLLQIPFYKLSNLCQGMTFGNVMFWISFVFSPPLIFACTLKYSEILRKFPIFELLHKF